MGFSALAGQYSTTFPTPENPLSEGGNWVNGKTLALAWSDCMVTNTAGAIGLEDPTGANYADATALLTGTWGSNQTCTATVYLSNRITGGDYEEVEFRLRSTMATNSNKGYEITFSTRNDSGAYVQLNRWEGTLGGFHTADSRTMAPLPNGVTLKAWCTNYSASVVRFYVYTNNVLLDFWSGYTFYDDGTFGGPIFTNGNPGIGFYFYSVPGGVHQTDFGFTSFTATDGMTNAPVSIVKRLGTGTPGVGTY